MIRATVEKIGTNRLRISGRLSIYGRVEVGMRIRFASTCIIAFLAIPSVMGRDPTAFNRRALAARGESPADRVASAVGPDARRADRGDVGSSSRRRYTADEPTPPQPEGRQGSARLSPRAARLGLHRRVAQVRVTGNSLGQKVTGPNFFYTSAQRPYDIFLPGSSSGSAD